MACSTLFLALSTAMAQPAAAQPAPPTAAAPTGSPAPYNLELSEAEIKRPEATYRLTARRWKQIVREDPHLWHLHKRGRLVIPGTIFLTVSGVWLSISTAVQLDSRGLNYRPTATESLFQWVLPSAMFVAGATMTFFGVRARRQLRAEQQKLYVAPYAAAGSGGVTVGGRF